jgi:hypothetical protein
MGQQQLLLIILGVIIVGIAIAVGLSLFSAQSVQANKDAIINDLNNVAAYCYQYKIRPTSMGGGQNSYIGCALPSKIASNDNATYVLSGATATAIVITGTSTTTANGSIKSTLDANGKATLDLSSFVQ